MGLDRREFLAGTTAGLAGLAVGGGCGDNTGRFGRFTAMLSIQTWTFRQFPIDVALDWVDQLGFARVELGSNHFSSTAADAAVDAMRAAIAARGLECVTAGLELPTADAAANRHLFEYARRLGLRTLLVDPTADSFTSLDALVAEFDVRAGIHNHGPGTRYPLIADVLAAVAGHDPRIGSILDTGHCLRSGEDPVDAIHRLAGRLYGLHLKDVATATADAPDVILGHGALDVEGVLVALRDVGVPADASLSIEYEANPDAPYDDVAAALALLEDLARRVG